MSIPRESAEGLLPAKACMEPSATPSLMLKVAVGRLFPLLPRLVDTVAMPVGFSSHDSEDVLLMLNFSFIACAPYAVCAPCAFLSVGLSQQEH